MTVCTSSSSLLTAWSEYEVYARTGKVLKADIDGNDDWDD